MLIDQLQSLIAVLITLIGVLLANSAPELHHGHLPTDWSNETHRQYNNINTNNYNNNKNSQDWLGGEETVALQDEVADHHWLSSRKSQEYLISVGGQEDCCPSQMEMIEPEGGSNPDGLYVELFSDGADKQRFYEVSCKPGVEGRPCLFMERKLHGHSTCVQRYSYSYAIVREENVRHHHHVHGGPYNGGGGGGNGNGNGNGNNNNNNNNSNNSKQTFQSLFPNDNNMWKLDYIKVRSGCACMVQSAKKQKQQKQRRKSGNGGDGRNNNKPPQQ